MAVARVAFSVRRTNKSGAKLCHDIHRIEVLTDRGLVSQNAETFLQQAGEWCDLFAQAVHISTDPDKLRPGMRRVYLGWLSQVRRPIGTRQTQCVGYRFRVSRR